MYKPPIIISGTWVGRLLRSRYGLDLIALMRTVQKFHVGIYFYKTCISFLFTLSAKNLNGIQNEIKWRHAVKY
jgi:hypothetical protein